jgi:phosphoribosylaminoimidazolecarboxamide formyltransferase/IMP cyclohydrolase
LFQEAWKMTVRRIWRALISVTDKSGLVDLARVLAALGVELISTGGTRKTLDEAGIEVRDIYDVTAFPEMLDGRVKTLHPKIHAGILALRDNAEHIATLERHAISPIDMVVCNLYPFEATASRPDSSQDEIIENIDIGGPTLIRAAAKNYRDVAVLTSPNQYAPVAEELRRLDGGLSLQTRAELATTAFTLVAAYDQAIHAYFVSRSQAGFPPRLIKQWRRKQNLRYGENPHQQAAFYTDPNVPHPCVATAETLHGKELSFNNLLDLDSALNLVREFSEPAAVVIKHSNPCGAATASTLVEAFQKAYEGDPLSAYGGVLAFNRELDEATAREITEPNRFIECMIAPSYSDAAYALLTTRPTWKKNVRLLRTGPLSAGGRTERELVLRDLDGGILVQTPDLEGTGELARVTIATRRPPSAQEMLDLRFAWLVCKHVKSNAIVLVRENMLVGVGAGQMSRVDSVHMAARKAGERSRGSVLASDAFFPFRDNVDEAARAGVCAIIQPGGSMRDEDSIQACNEHDMAMLLTGVRHFKH